MLSIFKKLKSKVEIVKRFLNLTQVLLKILDSSFLGAPKSDKDAASKLAGTGLVGIVVITIAAMFY